MHLYVESNYNRDENVNFEFFEKVWKFWHVLCTWFKDYPTDQSYTKETLRSMTWHGLTNQKYILTSPEGAMTFFSKPLTLSVIKFFKKYKKMAPPNWVRKTYILWHEICWYLFLLACLAVKLMGQRNLKHKALGVKVLVIYFSMPDVYSMTQT